MNRSAVDYTRLILTSTYALLKGMIPLIIPLFLNPPLILFPRPYCYPSFETDNIPLKLPSPPGAWIWPRFWHSPITFRPGPSRWDAQSLPQVLGSMVHGEISGRSGGQRAKTLGRGFFADLPSTQRHRGGSPTYRRSCRSLPTNVGTLKRSSEIRGCPFCFSFEILSEGSCRVHCSRFF